MANKEFKTLLTMGALSSANSNLKFINYYECKMKDSKKHLQISAIKNKILLKVASVVNEQKNL